MTQTITDRIHTGLLHTKLYPPRTTNKLVFRPRLLNQLEEGWNRPLTIVSAPAGFGKTTLVATWLEYCDCPTAWVSLSKQDSNLYTFLSFFLSALQSMFPYACGETLSLLNTQFMPPIPVIADILVNEIDDVDSEFVLVLDDYQLISDPAVHELINTLLLHPPRSMHLVLISRANPPLPLNKLRTLDQVTEIHVKDLRFTYKEAAYLIRKLALVSMNDKVASDLIEKAEGWVMGLWLAVISQYHRGSHIDDITASVDWDSTYVSDYLISEVLKSHPPYIQEFLVTTSILDRFCAPLCDAIATARADIEGPMPSGIDFLQSLEKSDLFVFSLDDWHQWYRYHHLFRRLLQRKLKSSYSPTDISALYSRASAWFAENGLVEEGIQCALAAGDVNKALLIIEQNRQSVLNNDKWYVLEKWLSMLPDTIKQQRP